MEVARNIIALKSLSFSFDEIKALFEPVKNINANRELKDNDKEKIADCSRIIRDKYKNILIKEQDIIRSK